MAAIEIGVAPRLAANDKVRAGRARLAARYAARFTVDWPKPFALLHFAAPMHHYLFPLIFIALVYIAMIVMNERYRLFSVDRFSSTTMKIIAYLWLGILLFGLVILIIGSSLQDTDGAGAGARSVLLALRASTRS